MKDRISKYKAVIFDLDGVICHTDKYHFQAWKSLADQLGIFFNEQINNRLRGVSRMESLEIILERYAGETLNDERKQQLASEKNDIYRSLLNNMSPSDLSELVPAALNQLRAMGLKLAIGSSSKNAPFILKQIGLEGYFDAISDGNNISFSKPDPEVFLKAAQYLGLQPDLCIVVEDAEAGIEAAHRAGMPAIAIGDAVRQGKGDFQIDEFSELIELMKNIDG